jgi:hypothetical protein
MIIAEPAWALPSEWLVACDVVWNIYIVLSRKMGFGHQEDVYFLGVEEYIFHTFGQPVFIPRRCVLFVNYFPNINTAVKRFMSVLICSHCLNKIISNLVMELCHYFD